jgi:hypothetical protein
MLTRASDIGADTVGNESDEDAKERPSSEEVK